MTPARPARLADFLRRLSQRAQECTPHTIPNGGLACSGILGGMALLYIDPRYLSVVGAVLITIALVLAALTPEFVKVPCRAMAS